jgi:AAA+ superfamily predicted ATPase
METTEQNIAENTPLTRNVMQENANSLSQEINWFADLVNHRLETVFPPENTTIAKSKEAEEKGFLGRIFHAKNDSEAEILEEKTLPKSDKKPIKSPDLPENDTSVYADFVRHYQLTDDERMVLMLVLLPHIQPHLLDVFLGNQKSSGKIFSEFGGLKGTRHGGFLPTIETAMFVLAGNDLMKRFRLQSLFEPDHFFSTDNILQIDPPTGVEPFGASQISLSEEYVDFFTKGRIRKPQFSMDFPAKRLNTKMEWADLVVNEQTSRQLEEIRIWLNHGRDLLTRWEMSKNIKPGYKALFHGSPGTGKTLTAALLGKTYGLEVYRIDLSMVISKYIGETEKNLEKIFRRAENKGWILFFDEADALFGKRTSISDAHDKYANQEIAYLLQRLEDYPGLVILASNMRNNVDEAFTRRLQSVIHFQKPQASERQALWQGSFSSGCQFEHNVSLEQIAQQYELSGGSIINVVQYASLMALNRNKETMTINHEDILQGIRKEFRKEGKFI